MYFKGTNTLSTQLVIPKDKDPKLQKSGIIYHYKCTHIKCTEAYIGETGRALGDRVNEHLKAPSPIYLQSNSTGHPLDPDCFNIIHKETHSSSRIIKEAMFIRVNDPTFKQEPRKVPASTYLGQHTTRHANTTAQAFQPPPLPPHTRTHPSPSPHTP